MGLSLTPPLNYPFAKYGIKHMNFLANTGSFFLAVILLFGFYFIRIALNTVLAKFYPHNKHARTIGMFLYLKNYLLSPLLAFQKLFLESYFQLTLASLLHMTAIVDFFFS